MMKFTQNLIRRFRSIPISKQDGVILICREVPAILGMKGTSQASQPSIDTLPGTRESHKNLQHDLDCTHTSEGWPSGTEHDLVWPRVYDQRVQQAHRWKRIPVEAHAVGPILFAPNCFATTTAVLKQRSNWWSSPKIRHSSWHEESTIFCCQGFIYFNISIYFNWRDISTHRYCWWKKSQTTTWDVGNLVNNGINYQPQLVAGFPSSTVALLHHGQEAIWESQVQETNSTIFVRYLEMSFLVRLQTKDLKREELSWGELTKRALGLSDFHHLDLDWSTSWWWQDFLLVWHNFRLAHWMYSLPAALLLGYLQGWISVFPKSSKTLKVRKRDSRVWKTPFLLQKKNRPQIVLHHLQQKQDKNWKHL